MYLTVFLLLPLGSLFNFLPFYCDMPLCSCFGPSTCFCTWLSSSFFRFGKYCPFLFLLLWSLSCLDWHTLCYSIGLILPFIFFHLPFFLSFSLLFWFYLPNNLFVLLYLFALLFKVFSVVFILAIELSNFNFELGGLLFFQRISPVLLIVSSSSPFSFLFLFLWLCEFRGNSHECLVCS